MLFDQLKHFSKNQLAWLIRQTSFLLIQFLGTCFSVCPLSYLLSDYFLVKVQFSRPSHLFQFWVITKEPRLLVKTTSWKSTLWFLWLNLPILTSSGILFILPLIEIRELIFCTTIGYLTFYFAATNLLWNGD